MIPIVKQKFLGNFVTLIPRATVLSNFLGIVIKIWVLDCLHIPEGNRKLCMQQFTNCLVFLPAPQGGSSQSATYTH